MRRARIGFAPLFSVLALVGCFQDHAVQSDIPAGAPADTFDHHPIDPSVQRALEESGAVEVIVLLEEPASETTGSRESALSRASSDATSTASGRYAEVQSRVIDALDEGALDVLTRYEQLPYLFLRLRSQANLNTLGKLPDVRRIYENGSYSASLAESLPLIKQPEVQAKGMIGTGTAVAVLDTGVDYSKAAFGSCSAAGGSCKVAFARDFAPEDNALDANGHGTNVAGIVLGVAPGTRILALDVFNGASGSASYILSAIDWVVQNRATYKIAAMNLSLGSGLFTASCPSDVFAAAMTTARNAGILAVVATGNNGATNAIASPACVPGVVSVGAVHDAAYGSIGFPNANCTDSATSADKVACFSNSASFMSLLAPGSRITAAGLTQSGTSQASPHVAGAVAVIRSAYPSDTLDDMVSRLTNKGPTITDARNGVAKRRLDLAAATADANPPDLTGPTASILINEGATLTRSATVSLRLSASDASGVAVMCVSNSDTCSSYVTFAEQPSWKLTSGDGLKKVNAWVKDTLGNVSKVTGSITLDTKKPTDGVLAASAGDGSVNLSWSGFSDTVSTVSYVLVQGADAAPASCSAGTVIYQGSSLTYAHKELINGKTYYYRLCALDGAGNLSAGKTASARPAPEFVAPTGTLGINDGATYTPAGMLNLAITGSDQSALTSMCLSTGTTACKTWVNFAETTTLAFTQKSGVLTVNLWLRDEWGNASAKPVTATINVDTKAPVMGGFTANASKGVVRLVWVLATDADSGMAGYRLVFAAGTSAPANCQQGTLLAEGANTLTYTHSGLAAGSYSYRLCAKDKVGNWATGKTLKATVP